MVRRQAVSKQGFTAKPIPLDAHVWARVVAVLKLSPQQARIVGLLLRGMRDKQIAAALDLSVATVRTYLSRIFVRLDVEDRVTLVLRVFAAARQRRTRHQDR